MDNLSLSNGTPSPKAGPSTRPRHPSCLADVTLTVPTNGDVDARVLAVFNNSLVFENIVPYLSFGDMKRVSEVNRDFCRIIRGSIRFQKKAVLVVSKDAKEVEKVLENSKQAWRGVRIVVPLPLKIVEIMRPFLASVDFVSLIPKGENGIGTVKGTQLFKFFMRMFSYTPKLAHLQVDVKILEKGRFEDISPVVVQEMLANLKKMEVLEWDYQRRVYKSSNAISSAIIRSPWDLEEDKEGIIKNIVQFASYSKSLEMFNVSKVMTRTEYGRKTQIMKYIPVILENSRERLQELSLHFVVWRLEEMKTLVFPNLKRLTAVIKGKDQLTLTQFLDRHASLEELDIQVKRKFSQPLLTAIQNRSSYLKKLHIKAREFSNRCGFVDWSFLGSMKLLKDFQISNTHKRPLDIDEFGTGPRFLAALPKNQLEKLSFRGISRFGFWVGLLDSEPDLNFKLDLLEGFTCLKSLSFLNCYDAVNDDVMQFILKEFTNLETLEVKNCPKLKDYGLSGKMLDSESNLVLNTEISLENLKALTSLTIHDCGTTSLSDFLTSVALPNLKYLEYLSSVNRMTDPEGFIQKVLHNNPRLETLTLDVFLLKRMEFQEVVRKKYQHQRCIKIVLLPFYFRDVDSESDGNEGWGTSASEDDEGPVDFLALNRRRNPRTYLCLASEEDDGDV